MLRQQCLHRATAGLERLEPASLPDPATVLLEQLADGAPQLELVAAGPLDVTAAAPYPRSRAALGAQRFEPFTTTQHDVRQVRQRLDVVDHRRFAIQPFHRGKWRLEPRLSPEAFERIDERGLLTADVRTCATVDDEVTREVAAQHAL